jgi:hypothetical protein
MNPATLDEKLYSLAKLMNPMYRISPDVVAGLRNFIVLVVERLIHTADIIANYGKAAVISQAELKIAVEIILPSELRSSIMTTADTVWRHYNETDNPSTPANPTNSANPPNSANSANSDNSANLTLSLDVPALSTPGSSEASETRLVLVPACLGDLMGPLSYRPITQSAIIYVTAVIETMARDLWTLTGDETTDDGMVVVIPRHLGRAVDKHPVYRRFCNWIAPVD